MASFKPVCVRISEICSFPRSHCFTSSPKFSGGFLIGRPNRTPRIFAAAIPSACLLRMVVLSFSAIKLSIPSVKSATKVPNKSFFALVSSKAYVIKSGDVVKESVSTEITRIVWKSCSHKLSFSGKHTSIRRWFVCPKKPICTV